MKKTGAISLVPVFLFLALSLFASALPSSSATLPDEQFTFPTRPPAPDYLGYASSNAHETRMATSYYVQVKYKDIPNAEELQAIEEIYECGKPASRCVPESQMSAAKRVGYYETLLGPCTASVQRSCIESLVVTNKDGKEFAGTVDSSFRSFNPQGFTGNSEYGLPTSGNSFLFDVPGVPHAGGTKYLVVAKVESRKLISEAKFSDVMVQTAIFAVSLENGKFEPNIAPSDLTYELINGKEQRAEVLRMGKYHPHVAKCVQQSQTQCAIPHPLPLDATFTITANFEAKLQGWLHGRISDASASLKVLSDGSTRLQVKAKPVVVPMIGKYLKRSELTKELVDYYTQAPKPLGGVGKCRDFGAEPDCLRQQLTFNEGAMREFLLWLPVMEDKAISAPTQWSVRAIPRTFSSTTTGASCYTDNPSVSGIVTTNATSYIASPPTFNATTQTLDYKVAAPHYLPDGREFFGTYDLLIDSKVARCIYGFTDAPIQASVTILSADGVEKATTTTVSERDGWLQLSAKGFTFSNPVLRVKLTQQEPLMQPKKVASKSITCIKGSSIKKVTAKSCPKGYKRK
jgi:hypothetical protein